VRRHPIEGVAGLQAFRRQNERMALQVIERDAFLLSQWVLTIDDGR